MNKIHKNTPYLKGQPMVDEKENIVAISPFPNRAERRKPNRLRANFTRTPDILKKIRRMMKVVKNKNSIMNKIKYIINIYKSKYKNG